MFVLMSKRVLSDEFDTNLRTIKNWLGSDASDNSVVINKDNFLIANSHKITLQKFEVSNDWLKPHHNCESSRGWRWFIEKINDEDENLTLFCELIDPWLLKDEKIYFHFLVATNQINIDPDNRRDRDLSPWFAVDWLKSTLDKYLS